MTGHSTSFRFARRLVTPRCLELLSRYRLGLFACEAHCISQWGHDFRPEYQQLSILTERFPEVPILALTATADGPTRRDIVAQLRLAEARVFAAGYDRPNLFYRVVPKLNPLEQLWRFLTRNTPPMRGSFIALPGVQLTRQPPGSAHVGAMRSPTMPVSMARRASVTRSAS